MLGISLEWWILYLLIIVTSSSIATRIGKTSVVPSQPIANMNEIVSKIEDLLSEVWDINNNVERLADEMAPIPSPFDD